MLVSFFSVSGDCVAIFSGLQSSDSSSFTTDSGSAGAFSRRTVGELQLVHDGQWATCRFLTTDCGGGGALALVFTTAAMVTVVSRTGCGRPLFGVRKIEFRWVGPVFFFLFSGVGTPFPWCFFPSMCMPFARGVFMGEIHGIFSLVPWGALIL